MVCHILFDMTYAILLSVIRLNVFMLNFIILSVVAPRWDMLSLNVRLVKVVSS
jgi:hypothetical protein